MNAYEFLGLETPTILEDNIDAIVEKKLTEKYQELIRRLNQILEETTIPNEEEVKKAKDVWKEYLTCKKAFGHIKSDGARRKYAASSVLPIEEEGKNFFDDVQQRAKISIKASNGETPKIRDAFQVLGLGQNKAKENYLRRFHILLREAVSKTVPDTLTECQEMLRKATKYIWAYTQVETEEAINTYKYKLKMLEAYEDIEKAGITLGIGKRIKIGSQNQPVLEKREGNGNAITITEIAQLPFGRPMLLGGLDLEGKVSVYQVCLKNPDDVERKFDIYADLDYERLQKDLEYKQSVINLLLTPEVIEFAHQYMGGYVGGIDGNGNLMVNPEEVAACLKEQEYLARKQKEGPTHSAALTLKSEPGDQSPQLNNDVNR